MGFDSLRVNGPAETPRAGGTEPAENGQKRVRDGVVTFARRSVPWLVTLGIAAPLALGLAWLSTNWYPATTAAAYAEYPVLAAGVAGSPAGAAQGGTLGMQSLQPAPVNVPLARQRVAEMFPDLAARLENPDAPSVTQEPGIARYTWSLTAARGSHADEATPEAQRAYVVLDPAGRLAGFGLE